MAVSTTYDSFSALANASSNDVRKVSMSSSGTNVVSEGDTKLFDKANDSMGKDQFLNLLIAQLKYQDPMSPADDTQFVSQLAQFSQLEFTQNSTQAIASLASNMQAFMDLQTLQAQSITNASATPLIGKEVRVMETAFEYKGYPSEQELNIHLNSKQGTVLIKDSEGNIVAEIGAAVESSKGGDTKITWNGVNPDTDVKSLSGTYTIEVVDDVTGATIVGYAYQDGLVSGVNFSSTGAALTINDKQFGLGYLVNVENDNSSSATSSSGSSSSSYSHISDDVMKKIASIMNYKDDKGAIEKIAQILGLDLDDDANYLGDKELGNVIEILGKDISEEKMMKQLADLLGQNDSDYAEMLKRVKAALT